jgi:hypothetical protein
LVGATDNIRKRAEVPSTYFETLKKSGKNISRHLLISSYSTSPSTLIMDLATFNDFKSKRTSEIFKIIEPIINYV